MPDTGKSGSDSKIAHLRDRLFLAPADIDAMAQLAQLLEQAGDLPGAIDLLQRALRVDPYRADIALRLGLAWAALSDGARARSWLLRALKLDPESAEVTRALADLDGRDGLSPAYIRTLFDQYAERFDAELTRTLHYRAPRLVAALLERVGVPLAAAATLDLGCGTGLSGAALKPFARRLDGVDLSPGMIAVARRRGIYDRLEIGEAGSFLETAGRCWDIIAAVDMLNYVGELTPILRLASRRLAAGGVFAGTVEKLDDGDVALTDKRRYAHAAGHVEAALTAARLTLMDATEETLRTEAGVPVAGLVFAAQKT